MKLSRRKFLTIMGATPIIAAVPTLAANVIETTPIIPINAGYVQKPGMPLAWCKFNAEGKMTSGYNVKGVKRNGVGNYSIGFDTAGIEADYTAIVHPSGNTVNNKTKQGLDIIAPVAEDISLIVV